MYWLPLTADLGAAGQLFRSVALCFFSTAVTAVASTSSSTSKYASVSSYLALCTPSTCRNGQCYTVNRTVRCYCQALFRGTRCEHVDLDQVSFAVIGSLAIFQWPRPPRLSGYSFVYYELNNPESVLYKTDIAMADDEHVALVGQLRGGYTMYRVCVEDEALAEKVVRQNAVEYLTNCVNLSTQPDYHTLVAWCIAALLAVVAVLLIYWQKDKFELLYFSKPVFLMYEHKQLDAALPSAEAKPS